MCPENLVLQLKTETKSAHFTLFGFLPMNMSWASSTCFSLSTFIMDLAVIIVAVFAVFSALSIHFFLIVSWLDIQSKLDLISLSQVSFSCQTFLDSFSSFHF